MANDKNDISDIVKKCKILLLDIEGTTTSISFVKDKLFPYAEENVKDFLNDGWESDDVKEAVSALRKLALEDEEKKIDGVITIPGEDASKEDQIDGLVKSVKWQMSLDRKAGPLKQLQGLIWKKGYDKGDIKGHVYDDVSPALELWRSVEGQKVYIYSSGSVQAQKLLFSMSSSGDMLKLIDGHFDTAVGAKQEAASYTVIAEKINCKPEEILFLTDIDKEAEAARSAGVQAAIVSREGNAPLAEGVAASYPVLYSFAELAATNKRKPDAQDEQPAKVLKTDVEADVKTAAETAVKESTEPITSVDAKPEESEKMEVEEAPSKEDLPAEKPKEIEKVVTIVEEVTDLNEVKDVPVSDIEPVIEESPDKTEQKETEKMETNTTKTEEKEAAPLKNGDKDEPMSEETSPAVITEIKDITNDQESLNEAVETIEDIVPVVEEPPAQDMEELQNVGEVLEKECDEILSKVQDVTNLDNMPLKPSLNPIVEETMETENTDTNDIVERILDSELELEMKQCTDIDLNTVQEISDEKESTTEGKSETQPSTNSETTTDVLDEKSTEKMAEETKVTEEKVDDSVVEEKSKESSPTEQKVEESSPTEAKTEEIKADEDKTKTAETENKMETDVSKPAPDSIPKSEEIKVDDKLETEEKKVEDTKSDEDKSPKEIPVATSEPAETATESEEDKSTEESVEKPVETPAASAVEAPAEKTTVKVTEENTMETDQSDATIEKIENDKVVSAAEEVKPDSDAKETQLNGKTTNGDTEMVNLNGDSNKQDELSSRLSMENGKEIVNGANGDSNTQTNNENNGDEVKEVADIKVKTVAIDEPRNDPIEQPTEA